MEKIKKKKPVSTHSDTVVAQFSNVLETSVNILVSDILTQVLQ